jgi:hypothetical protein
MANQSILRKDFETSEESPLELRSPYCSDPDCEYWRELREIEDKCKISTLFRADASIPERLLGTSID